MQAEMREALERAYRECLPGLMRAMRTASNRCCEWGGVRIARSSTEDEFMSLASLAALHAAATFDAARGYTLAEWIIRVAFGEALNSVRSKTSNGVAPEGYRPPNPPANDLWRLMLLDLSKDAILIASWLSCYEGGRRDAVTLCRRALCPEPLSPRRFFDAAAELKNYLSS